MSIWFRPYQLEEIRGLTDIYMTQHLGIELTEIGEDYLVGKMPVDERTKMPLGLLHGGASCVLAETLASYAANFYVNPEERHMVGLEINANHLRSVTSGYVTGTCRPLHLGKSTQVWDIRICDDQGQLVCISRMTTATLKKK